MSKKDYKLKKSKALTKQRKLVSDPEIQKKTDEINHNPGVWKKGKKAN